MPKYMGFEGKLYWGAAGSTAATELTIARDVRYTIEGEFADVSDRSSIVNLSDVAGVSLGLEFEINNKSTDAAVAAIRTAVTTGAAMALLTKDAASGWGMDADFVLSLAEEQPLRDAQRLRITAQPTDKSGRTPSFS